MPSPERWARIEAALDAALDRLDEPRDALLRELCGDDEDLSREVSRLLRSIAASTGHFEHPPIEMVEAAAATVPREQLEPGDVVGVYRVLETIGRGGMGVVYLAERADGAFERQVALKVVKRGMDSDEILRRFRSERQILARLEHPNIAGLLDGGITDDGIPYFVMELAQGPTIDQWADERRLSIRERLNLLLPVCDAVRHAHRSLIVHRDLKPSNIVVVEGVPKLLDFGIAKVLSGHEDELDQQATRLQERRLTPDYAAPEQILGQPTTTATDVYALGVILYELLTGRAPYRVQGGLAEIERIVTSVMPRTPSTVISRDDLRGRHDEDALELASRRGTRPDALRDALRGDLDAIVMKALAKEQERRYPSVDALAEDLRRHLAGHAVEARPASRWYLAGKFVRRNRVAVTLAAGAVAALVIGAGVATWQAQRASAESQRAQAEAERASAARDYLIGIFRDLNPERLQGRRTLELDDIIHLSLRNLEPLAAQPELQASVMNAVGEVLFNLGDDALADSLYTRAHEILSETSALHPDLAESMMGLGEVERRADRFAEAERWLRQALAIRLDVLASDDPRIAESEAALAFALYNLDRRAEADSLYRHVLTFQRLPTEVRAAVLEGRADIRLADRNYTEARDLYRASLQAWEQTVGLEHPSYGRCLWGFGTALDQLGQSSEAERAFRDALAIMLSTYGTDHRDAVWAHFFLGRHLASTGQHAEATDHLANAALVSERVNPPGYRYTVASWDWLGRSHLALDRADSAALAFGRAVDAQHMVSPAAEQELVRSAELHEERAGALFRMDRLGAAESELRAALEELPAGDAHAAVRSRIGDQLADILRRTGRADSADAVLRRTRSRGAATGVR